MKGIWCINRYMYRVFFYDEKSLKCQVLVKYVYLLKYEVRVRGLHVPPCCSEQIVHRACSLRVPCALIVHPIPFNLRLSFEFVQSAISITNRLCEKVKRFRDCLIVLWLLSEYRLLNLFFDILFCIESESVDVIMWFCLWILFYIMFNGI